MYIEIIFALVSAHAEVQGQTASATGYTATRKLTRADLLANDDFRKCWEGSATKPKPRDCSVKPQETNIDQFVKVDSSQLPNIPLEGDIDGIRSSIANALAHCKAMKADKQVSVGGRAFTQKDLCLSANQKLQQLAKKPASGPDITLNEFLTRVKRDFDFYQYTCDDKQGNVLFTGYYSPTIRGRSAAEGSDSTYRYPIYRKPDDLVIIKNQEVVCAGQPGERKITTETIRRKLPDGSLAPYYTREEIDNGVLRGKGLELAYVDSSWQAHDMQIQGTAAIEDSSGKILHLNMDERNGFAWSGTARALKCLKTDPKYWSMQGIGQWLKENPDKAGAVEAMDESYIFFVNDGRPPQGVEDVSLTPKHSVAVDPAYFPYEIPVLLSGQRPALDSSGKVTGSKNFEMFALAQDKGGGIKKCHIDTYWGEDTTRDKTASTTAGSLKSNGPVYVAIPKP